MAITLNNVISKITLGTGSIDVGIVISWKPQDFSDDKST